MDLGIQLEYLRYSPACNESYGTFLELIILKIPWTNGAERLTVISMYADYFN